MRQKTILLIAIMALIVYSIATTVKVRDLQTSLKSTRSDLLDAQNKLQNAKDQLENISEKLNLQSSSADDFEDKVDNIQSYISDLEYSISGLLREIRWAECDACQNAIWYIERKAKSVESDFENLQSEISY